MGDLVTGIAIKPLVSNLSSVGVSAIFLIRWGAPVRG
jgi:hypothetical protein